MATRAQIEANRKNASKSTGPKSGTDRTRFNGLKHGLRAEQVVLPGEDPADFEAEKQAWLDDWKPASHTRAVLVERAAVASWKLRRATRSEAVRLYEAGADAAHEFDLAQRERIDVALHRLAIEPGSSLARLRCDAAGLDALIGLWDALAEAAARPGGWHSRPEHHDRLLALLGHPAGSDPQGLEVARASLALLGGDDPAAAAGLRAFCLDRAAELRRERSAFWDPAVIRRRTIDLACAPTSKEAQLLHRYERRAREVAVRGDPRARLPGKLGRRPPRAPLDPSPSRPRPGRMPRKNRDATPVISSTCVKLASVGEAAPPGVPSGRSPGSPGRPGGRPGPIRGPGRPRIDAEIHQFG